MAVTFSIGPNPKWYFVDKSGKPLAGGKFFTYSSLNFSLLKPVYSDPDGNFALPDPIIISADGTAGPFWFKFDSTNPDDGYFIRVTDANDVEMWTVIKYFASTGGGGGGGTTVIDIENLITNNVFYRHSDGISPVPTFSLIAPSNNAGFVENLTTPKVNPSPDISFVKDTNVATDTISYPLFSPLGFIPLFSLGDITPVDYFRYQCTIPDPAQTVKCLQFPITSKVQNLSNQPVIGSFFAFSTGPAVSQQVVLRWLQYFGDGVGASPPITTIINTFTLTNNVWTECSFTSTVPDVAGKTLGAPFTSGPNDSLFLQIQFGGDPPVDVCDIGITKLSCYVGTAIPTFDFESYDEIDSIISSPRTGDIRIALNSFQPFGWVPCNDGTLANGDPATVAPTGINLSRNNADTYPLYSLIWNKTINTPNITPIYDVTGALTTRGATAIADFSASKQLSLTKTLGRVLAGANPQSVLGQAFTTNYAASHYNLTMNSTDFPTGTPVQLITSGALPSRLSANTIYYVSRPNLTIVQLYRVLEYALVQPTQVFTTNFAASHFKLFVSDTSKYFVGQEVGLSNSGGALPTNLNATTVYYVTNIDRNVSIQLSISYANAISPTGTPIDIGSDQSGTSNVFITAIDIGSDGTGTVLSALAAYAGTDQYILQGTDLPAHVHTNPPNGQFVVDFGGTLNQGLGPGALSINNVTGPAFESGTPTSMGTLNNPFSLIQPTTFFNVFLKL